MLELKLGLIMVKLYILFTLILDQIRNYSGKKKEIENLEKVKKVKIMIKL